MRERSLKLDRRDEIALRHARQRRLGTSVASEFYQPCPMFFTREMAQLNIIGMYRGSTVFIISNGPSLRDLDLSLLHKAGVMTYGLNNGPKTFRPNLWSCVDDPQRFLKSIWLDPKIQKIVPVDHFERFIFDSNKWETMKIRVGDCPNVIGFKRNEKFMAARWLWEDSLNWGNHKDYGGGRTVLLPVMRTCFLLGFRKVYLLGVDLNMSEENTYHFDEERNGGAVSGNLATYRKMNDEYFPALKPEFDEVGFEVYNCNPTSGLTVFPYVSYEDAIKDATKEIGDTTTERVYGLYTKPEEKAQLKNEPPLEQKKNRIARMELQKEQEQTVKDDVVYPNPNATVEPVQEIVQPPVQEPVQAPVLVQEPVQEENKKQPKIIPYIPEMKPLSPEEQAQIKNNVKDDVAVNANTPPEQPKEQPAVQQKHQVKEKTLAARMLTKERPYTIVENDTLATSTLGKK